MRIITFVRSLRALLAGITILSGASAASAGEYLFHLRGMTPNADVPCDDFAYAEGQRLEQFLRDSANPIKTIRAACKHDDVSDSNAWTIAITYTAESPLPVVSTLDTYSISRPGFDKKADCLTGLAAEREIFTRATGLAIFSAYCKEPSFSSLPWEVSIVGFGTPAIKPFNTSTNLYGKILNHTRESFTSMLHERFASANMELAQVSFSSNVTHLSLDVRYYGQTRINLSDNRVAIFGKPEHCASVVDSTKAAVVEAGVQDFGVFCVANSLLSSQTELTVITTSEDALTLATPEAEYETYEACEAAKPEVMRHYQQDLGRNILAGYCSFQPFKSKPRVVMLEKI